MLGAISDVRRDFGMTGFFRGYLTAMPIIVSGKNTIFIGLKLCLEQTRHEILKICNYDLPPTPPLEPLPLYEKPCSSFKHYSMSGPNSFAAIDYPIQIKFCPPTKVSSKTA